MGLYDRTEDDVATYLGRAPVGGHNGGYDPNYRLISEDGVSKMHISGSGVVPHFMEHGGLQSDGSRVVKVKYIPTDGPELEQDLRTGRWYPINGDVSLPYQLDSDRNALKRWW